MVSIEQAKSHFFTRECIQSNFATFFAKSELIRELISITNGKQQIKLLILSNPLWRSLAEVLIWSLVFQSVCKVPELKS